MSNTKIIRPYVAAPTNMETLDGALYKENLSKVPGAVTILLPSLDAKGKVKTGLDDEENLDLRAKLEEVLGEKLDGSSEFYQEYRERGLFIKDGDNVYDLSNPQSAVEYYLIIKTPQVAKSIDDFTNGLANTSRTYLYIHDPELEETKKYSANKEKTECVFALGGAQPDVLRQVAVLTGTIIRMEASEEEVFNNLSEAIDHPGDYAGGKFRSEFLRFVRMEPAERKVEVLTHSLLKNNVVQKIGKTIKEANTKLADTEEDFKRLLLTDDELYISFRDKLNTRKTITAIL